MSIEVKDVTREQFDGLVKEVLGGEDYLFKLNEKMSSFLERFRKWLEDFLADRVSADVDVVQLSDTLSLILMSVFVIGIVMGAALIGRWLYVWLKNRGKIEEILGEKITKETTPHTLLARAKGAEKEADYRLGVRYAYIGLLLLMHEKGLLYIEKTMTNMEIYKALEREQYKDLEAFRDVMEIFNYTWYGQNAYTEEAYKSFWEKEMALWNEVTSK